MTLQTDKQKAAELWHEMDSDLMAKGHYFGVPLLLGSVDLARNTRDPILKPFLKEDPSVDELSKNLSPGEILERIGTERVVRAFAHNSWRVEHKLKGSGVIYVLRHENGKVNGHFVPKPTLDAERLVMWVHTVGIRASGTLLEAELKARAKLRSLLKESQWQLYDLEGAFLEVSSQSQVHYLIRRGRPTIALKEWKQGMRVLTTLCMHPMSYYKETWAGALAPSDDVIAHLLYIRGDEYDYWKRANHIPIDDPRSGV